MSNKVILMFEDEDAKQEFMSQLSDGWGENYVGLKWQGHFDESDEFEVEIFEDEYYDWEDNNVDLEAL